MPNQKLLEVFAKQAGYYANRQDKKTFDVKYRKRLLECTQGRVLEVAVGTGANFRFYKHDVEVTAVDFSPVMLNFAKQAAVKHNIKANFINLEVEKLEFAENSFDTVVSTLSLCTYKDPLRVLNLFNHWCRPGGRILLLEHGRSSSKFCTWILNTIDNWHLRNWGCHANTDILKLVADSDLKVERIENYLWFYYLIWAKPSEYRDN